MSTPSKEDIEKVKTNINNMISFNKDLLEQANIKLESAYALLSQTDNTDLGLSIGINLLGGAFWALGSLLGPLGNIPANFLSGMVSQYATNTPPSLNGTFSSLLLRFQKTFNQLDADLADYYQDPVKNWDKTLSGSFNTPFDTINASGKLSDLAGIVFPVQTDPNYYIIQNGCIKGLDQTIWATLLSRFVITHYVESRISPWSSPCDTNDIDNKFLRANKSYYHVWRSEDNTDKHGKHYTTYYREEYNIGTGAGTFSDGALNDSACDYLFHNYSSDIENDSGLFERIDVFTKLNIPKTDHWINNGGFSGFKFSTLFRSTYIKPLFYIHNDNTCISKDDKQTEKKADLTIRLS
jgi:hypothetical protein